MTGNDRGAVLTDGIRLAVGTLTAMPVPPPVRVDPRRARLAMALAPAAALLPGAAAAVTAAAALVAGLSPPLTAALAVSASALATRGMHLDGLADTADGLAASYDRERALEVMRTGTTGPAGMTSVVLLLAIQITALSQALGGLGPLAALLGVVIGRIPVTVACTAGVPAARRDGLGATFAGQVPRPVLAVSLLVTTAVAGGLMLLMRTSLLTTVLPVELLPTMPGPSAVGTVLVALAAVLITVLATVVVLGRAVSRLGGITGDVLGALVEIGTATTLVVLAATVG
jgi:adenosylcobinamide-GDP ribazoletransferase